MEPRLDKSNRFASRDKAFQEFMEHYDRLSSFYEVIAKEASKICRAAIKERGIQGYTIWRVKGKDSLRVKIDSQQKRRGHPYENWGEIENEISDLAGVRVVLHVPSQRDIVGDMIKQRFEIHDLDGNETTNPDPISDPALLSVWSGYGGAFPEKVPAHHQVHLVSIKPEDVPEKKNWHKGVIEIQVLSILEHTRVEVRNSWVCQKRSMASEGEEQILGWLGGILSLGECLLDQLHERRNYDGPFENSYALGSFLSKWMQVMADRKSQDLGDVESLWQLLKILGLDGPKKLREILIDMDFSLDPNGDYAKEVIPKYRPFEVTVATYIMDRIIRSPDRVDKAATPLDEEVPSGDDEIRDRIRVLIDSLVWLDYLAMTSDWAPVLMATTNRAEWAGMVKGIQWLNSWESIGFCKYDGGTPSRKSVSVINTLWSRFINCDSHLVRLLFDLSRLGVVKTHSLDQNRLRAVIDNLSDIANPVRQ